MTSKSSARVKNIFALFCLIATSWTIIATSKVNLSLLGGYLNVKSDCPGATTEARVHVSLNQVDQPTGASFTDFGFPNARLEAEAPNTGVVGGVARSCVRTIGNTNAGKEWVYTCTSAGEFLCTILVRSE